MVLRVLTWWDLAFLKKDHSGISVEYAFIPSTGAQEKESQKHESEQDLH